MDPSLFFVFGPALVVLALVVSFVGLRYDKFPTSTAAMAIGLGLFVLLVGATAALAVINAEHESIRGENQEAAKKAHEQAIKNGNLSPTLQTTQPASGAGGTTAPPAKSPASAASGGVTLKITSPADGGLSFAPASLSAKAGTVTIDYNNPSPVQHSVAIGTDTDTLAESDLVIKKATKVTAKLKPGSYFFYCTVPGHREAGMQGKLVVK